MPSQPSPSIKAGFRAIARRAVAVDPLWRVMGRLAGQSGFLTVQRQVVVEGRFEAKRDRFFSGGHVLAGPFAGIAYPEIASFGSALFPKLLGVYESELIPTFEALRGNTYEAIIDIGFAEGYYLAGLGRMFEQARLLGVDINPEAHRLCANLLRHNSVAEQRLQLSYDTQPATLEPFLARRALAVVDCEGFEAELFTPASVAQWRRADLVIECHDFLRPGITDRLLRLLQATHEISLVPTLSPIDKLAQVPAEAREMFSEEELLRLLSEGRPAAMQWIVARSRG